MNDKELKKKESLFNYWDDLPMVTKINLSREEGITHEVRDHIIYYIRKGKKEKDSKGVLRVRHSFSAKELLSMISKKLERELKLQSMYFHLNKLQEHGLIYVVTILHEGKHNVAYFGRTARGFLFESSKEDKYEEYFAEGNRFATALNSEISKNKFKDYLKEFRTINKESEEQIIQWLEDRKEFINENNIDSATMFSFLRRINFHNERMVNLMKEIAELIEFEFTL